MAKSRADMMKHLGKLLAKYAEFQRRRPDLPQGDLRDLSEQELDLLVTEFQRHRRLKQTTPIHRHRDPCSTERRPARL